MNAPILFGDVSSKEVLNASGIKTAKVIVFAISDPGVTRTAVKISRSLNRDILIIVRTKYVVEIDELYKLGANQVIPEEFETSIEIIIIAVVRGEKSFTTPPSDFIIGENDILVLVANHQDMDRAFKFLRSEDITT